MKNLILLSVSLLGIFTANLFAKDTVLLFTPPKSGTFLTVKTIGLLTKTNIRTSWLTGYQYKSESAFLHFLAEEKMNRFIHSHQFCSLNLINDLHTKGYKVFYTYRDPRDAIISLIYFINARAHAPWTPYHRKHPFRRLSFEEKLDELITGRRYGWCYCKEYHEKAAEWIAAPEGHICITRFEDLLGPKGGGSEEKQEEAITQIANALGITLTQGKLEEVKQELWGKSLTFRKGKANGWRAYFSKQNEEDFNERYSELLSKLGYAN